MLFADFYQKCFNVAFW